MPDKPNDKAVAKPSDVQIPPPINPDNVRSVYSNNAEVGMSAFDARITFNEVIVGHGGQLTVERRANVIMSIPHFRLIFEAMKQQLEQFEAKAEEIKAVMAKPSSSAKT